MPDQMPPHAFPPLPDPAAAHRALREVRNAMRAGLGVMRDTVDHAPLPTPVTAVAGTVLRRVDHLAQQAEAMASTVAHGLLTAAGIDIDDRGRREAVGLAVALRRAAEALGMADARVSEGGVGDALRQAGQPAPAAAVMRALLAAGAVRAEAADAVVFAALMARLQPQGAEPAVVAACAALADALSAEIRAAAADEAALARLFGEFRNHV